jgi:hypothetical protein
MPANAFRQIVPNAQSWASVAKDHSAQFIAKALGFLWVGGVAETLCEFEKLLLLAPLSLDPVFDEFHQHPVGTELARFCQLANLRRNVCWKADALAYRFVSGLHSTSMHQNGAIAHVPNPQEINLDLPW